MGAKQSNPVRPSEKTCCGCFLSRHESDTDTEMKFTPHGAPVGYWPHHEASAPTMMPYGPPGMQNGPGVMMVPPAGPLPRPPCAFDTHDIDLRPRMRVLSVGGDSLEESLLFALTKEDSAPVGYWPHHEASAPTMMPYGPPVMQNGPGVMMVPPAGPLPRPPCAFDTHDTTRAPITAAVYHQQTIGQPTAPQTTQIDLRPRMRVLSVGGDSLEESLLFALTKEDKMAELTREVNEHVLNRPLPTEAYGGDVIIESTRPEGRT
ncbi:unnamed protein product [Vitrella brassicaformis CCMP3155]|uniref:Uncharacterized protein n=1 Tax=Vitrella brassicaformis (strain CCMP3155) TaxID=1169540 RepID=A0A0G4FGH8_VITBC|nr:unnamed protein product [Vitrella brassicaformis CCMP3155]|eukprot:CEM11940.1 unnamed protein product [Vitrella brassicaformis CCMP3155]